MLVKLVHGVILGTCLCVGGCGSCALTPGGHLDPLEERIEASDQSSIQNGNAGIVGNFKFISGTPSQFIFSVNLSYIKGGASSLTYTLEVYSSGTACPPDPSSRLSVLGTATDSDEDVMFADFDFTAPSSLQSLDGKILVLRAAAPDLQPVVGVVCTAPVQYVPAMEICAGD